MNENRWTTIQQVPIGAFFRRKTRPTEIFPISGINLQYAGGMPMPGLELKATPAVQIELTWWRLSELDQMFEYSFDGVTWSECNGVARMRVGDFDVGPELDRITERVQSNSRIFGDVQQALKQQIEFAERQQKQNQLFATRLDELQKSVAELTKKPEPAKAPEAGADKKKS